MFVPPDTLLPTVGVIVVLLFLATLVAILAQRLNIPYTVALVVCGVAIAETHWLPPLQDDIARRVLFLIFLPPLLFEGAFHLNVAVLRTILGPVTLLALPGVMISAGVTAAIVHSTSSLSWLLVLLFGSSVAATDPVAVLAVLRHLGVSERLRVILEGESLFNDGTALVLFTTLLGTLGAAFSPWHLATTFVGAIGGGVVVGGGLGVLFSRLSALVDDHFIEMTLSTVLAYGGYIAATVLGVSGVIAVVAAGLVFGTYGRLVGMSEKTRPLLSDLWEYGVFLANSLLFLFIGMAIPLHVLIQQLPQVAWAIVATVVGRAVVLYGAGPLLRMDRHGLPLAYRHVLFWGGLRGALSIAAVLSLPASIAPADRLLLRSMVFGVVLFTLLVQGVVIGPLVRMLGMQDSSPG